MYWGSNLQRDCETDLESSETETIMNQSPASMSALPLSGIAMPWKPKLSLGPPWWIWYLSSTSKNVILFAPKVNRQTSGVCIVYFWWMHNLHIVIAWPFESPTALSSPVLLLWFRKSLKQLRPTSYVRSLIVKFRWVTTYADFALVALRPIY